MSEPMSYERLRSDLTATQGALLHVIDAVKMHGDKAGIAAMHEALGQSMGGKVVDERNHLRREAVDLRDALAAMTAERDQAFAEASEKDAAANTMEVRAEDAEAEVKRLGAELATTAHVLRATGEKLEAIREQRDRAEAERDHHRERLAEDDKGAVILGLEETVAAADADRDRLTGQVERVRELLKDYGSGFIGAGMVLDVLDGEEGSDA